MRRRLHSCRQVVELHAMFDTPAVMSSIALQHCILPCLAKPRQSVAHNNTHQSSPNYLPVSTDTSWLRSSSAPCALLPSLSLTHSGGLYCCLAVQGTVRPGCTQFVLRLLGPMDLTERIDAMVAGLGAQPASQQPSAVNAAAHHLPSSTSGAAALKKLLQLPGMSSVPRIVIQGPSMVADLQHPGGSTSTGTAEATAEVQWAGTVCQYDEHPASQSAPSLLSVEPACITLQEWGYQEPNDVLDQDQQGQQGRSVRQSGAGRYRLLVHGRRLAQAAAAGSIRVRQRGYDLAVTCRLVVNDGDTGPSAGPIQSTGPTRHPGDQLDGSSAQASAEAMELLVSGVESEGLLVIEAQHGPLLSNSLQVRGTQAPPLSSFACFLLVPYVAFQDVE